MDQRRPLGKTPEVAAYLGVPVQTLYVWRTKGEGPPAVRVGRHLRYRWSDVDTWVEQQAVTVA
jgi:excisionase family DNA binding protein